VHARTQGQGTQQSVKHEISKVQELVTVLEHFNRTQSLHKLHDLVVAGTLPNAGTFGKFDS
jgi:hypothetical protein